MSTVMQAVMELHKIFSRGQSSLIENELHEKELPILFLSSSLA